MMKKPRPTPQKLKGVKHVVAVASGKGGVGKSTVAVNLATALSVAGLKVGLLDADIYGPSQPRMTGTINAEPQSDGDIIDPVISNGIKCMSIGYLVDENDPIIWRGPLLQRALQQMLLQVNWGELDVLLIDMPPGTGDVQISLPNIVEMAGAVIVSTPQDIALLDTKKAISMFEKVEVTPLGFIENMSAFICPECHHESHIFSHGGAKQAATELNIPFLGEVPLDIALREQTDTGKPVVIHAPESKVASCFKQIAQGLIESLETSTQSNEGPVKVVIQ